MIISARNSLANESWVPITRLTSPVSSGTNVLAWENPSGFSASWAIQIGKTGEEQTEIKLLGTATPDGVNGTLTANTDFEHPTDTPIYGIKYDKMVFAVSTSGTSGTVSPITNGTVDIGADSQNTIYDYTSGASTDAYKVKFRNSVLLTESSYSDWILPGGFEFYTLGRIRERIKEKLFSSGYIKSDDTINDWINEWRETMNNAAVEINEDFTLGTVDVGFSGTAEYATVTNTDFKGIRRVWYTDNGTDWYRALKMEQVDFEPDEVFVETRPYYFMAGDDIIGRRPNDNSGTFRISYYSSGTELSNDSDTLPLPMRGYTRSFVHYGLAQAYLKDSKLGLYQSELGLAEGDLSRFTKQITPRNESNQTTVKILDYVSYDYDDNIY